MIRILTYGSLKIWVFIQQLHAYNDENLKELPEVQEFICYFKFSEPTVIVYGELIREKESGLPLTFQTMEEAEHYASDYVAKRFQLRK
jgi:hypothetical protein